MSDEFKLVDFLEGLQKESVVGDIPTREPYFRGFQSFVIERYPKYSLVHVLGKEASIDVSIDSRLCANIATEVSTVDSGYIVAYPNNPYHAQLFASSDTASHGPNFLFPGSILNGRYTNNTQHDTFSLDYLQFSFKQGDPVELTRSIASKYMSARQRVLQAMLSYSDNFPKSQIFPCRIFTHYGSNESLLQRLLEKKSNSHTQEKKSIPLSMRQTL